MYLSAAPWLSRATTCTKYTPGLANVWFVFAPPEVGENVSAVPSPQLHV